jgi:hypothetical protein
MSLASVAAPRLDSTTFALDDPGARDLSADGLLLYCEEQMSQIAEGLSARMESQKAKHAQAQALEAASTALDPYPNGLNDKDDKKNGNAAKTIYDAIDKAVATFPEGTPAREALTSARDKFKDGGSFPSTHDDMQGVVDTLKSQHDSVGDDATINMMQIQELMSKRQSAVELTTNLMAAYSETLKALAANIGK